MLFEITEWGTLIRSIKEAIHIKFQVSYENTTAETKQELKEIVSIFNYLVQKDEFEEISIQK
ncbi:MAG: hypothetical protein ACI88L_000657 [Candidatus Paceibacteria bacterium]|jgi:hypothetical protein